jgi:hypothetical protein
VGELNGATAGGDDARGLAIGAGATGFDGVGAAGFDGVGAAGERSL